MTVVMKEGAYYKRRDGEIVGPSIYGEGLRWPWEVGRDFYGKNGFYLNPSSPHPLDLIEEVDAPREEVEDGIVSSDGGSTRYYQLPEGAKELLDLIEDKDMPYPRANVFKACYRLGSKKGVDILYDLKKMKFFIERMIESYEKGKRV